MTSALSEGARLFTATVKDRYTAYGLVVVAIVQGDTVSQYVMSCRVLGLRVEPTVLSLIEAHVTQEGHDQVRGVFKATSANHLSSILFSANGFGSAGNGVWSKAISLRTEKPAV